MSASRPFGQRSQQRVIIIGAGFGGLSAAACLAHSGCEVTVLERLRTVGGRAQTLQHAGFHFDIGPSWYWMPDEHDRWFALFGERRSDYYSISRLDPSYRVYFGDIVAGESRRVVDMPAAAEGAAELFDYYEPGAGRQFQRHIAACQRRYELAMSHFIYRNWERPLQIINRTTLSHLAALRLDRSYAGLIESRFKHPYLRRILQFPTVFLGADPSRIPAVYTLMNHIDFGLGTWYPAGGFGAVVAAMRRVAERQGARFLLATEAMAIESDQGRARAVRCRDADGIEERLAADAVVVNADYPYAEQELLVAADRDHTPRWWRRRRLAPSALNFYIALDRRLAPLAHHTFFFDSDWHTHISDIYHRPRWPRAPLFYLHIPSRTDPTAAPPDCESLFVLIPIAAGLEDSPSIRDHYLDLVLKRIERRSGLNIAPHIKFLRSWSVNDFAGQFNAYRGNAFGLGQTLLQTAGFRPANRSRRLANLYYCGHFTQPGTGTTMSMISGELAARRVIAALSA